MEDCLEFKAKREEGWLFFSTKVFTERREVLITKKVGGRITNLMRFSCRSALCETYWKRSRSLHCECTSIRRSWTIGCLPGVHICGCEYRHFYIERISSYSSKLEGGCSPPPAETLRTNTQDNIRCGPFQDNIRCGPWWLGRVARCNKDF